jgi:hypothetical protein
VFTHESGMKFQALLAPGQVAFSQYVPYTDPVADFLGRRGTFLGMSRLDHFLILHRFAPEAPPFSADEVRQRLASGPWRDTTFHVLAADPFLLAWKGAGADVGPTGERVAFLRVLGNPYNAGTARPADIAAGNLVAAGELDGTFAAFAFDPASRQATLLTDRFGLFPLFTHEQDGSLCYSTSLSMLLSVRRPVCRIDPLSVGEMLTLRMVLGNRTFLREVNLVSPATAVHLRLGQPVANVYWSWSGLRPAAASDADFIADTYHLIEQAVLRGVPPGARKVGLPLDGGLASRLLCAILARNGVTVRAYTTQNGKDGLIASEVARVLGMQLCERKPFDAPQTIASAHEAIHCSYHVSQTAGWEMARRAAEEDGCEVLFDGQALDAVLGPAPYAFRDNSAELARELEADFERVDRLDKKVGDHLRTHVYPSVRDSLKERAAEALDHAGPLAPEQYLMTNRIRKHVFGSCLASMAHLPGRFPCFTTRLFEHGMRLPGEWRHEHRLVRGILCERFADLARIPWARTELPLDRYAEPPPPARWRPWLEDAVRWLSRGRLSLTERDRFDVELRNRAALKEAFLSVLSASTPGLDKILPPEVVAQAVRGHRKGRNLGGLLQGLYTVKHFLVRHVASGMATLGD